MNKRSADETTARAKLPWFGTSRMWGR